MLEFRLTSWVRFGASYIPNRRSIGGWLATKYGKKYVPIKKEKIGRIISRFVFPIFLQEIVDYASENNSNLMTEVLTLMDKVSRSSSQLTNNNIATIN